ncbi:MAG: flagellar export chaperone FliS [Pseudomonadota bacterium]|nr:flagellar export chaperone FliS [Pseudomonadota bacterium]
MNTKQAMSTYLGTRNQSNVDSASPVQLITMLFNGALERINTARYHMERGEVAEQGETIGKIIDIVASLDAYLDHDNGGDLSKNLESLYDYIVRQLFDANRKSDLSILDEVASLLMEVRAGWVESTKNQG